MAIGETITKRTHRHPLFVSKTVIFYSQLETCIGMIAAAQIYCPVST